VIFLCCHQKQKKVFMAKNHITFDFRAFRQALVDGILETLVFGSEDSGNGAKQRKTEKAKRWLKGHEVRRLLGISAEQLQELRDDGSLPYKREFGTYRYDYQAIMDMVSKEPVRPAPRKDEPNEDSRP
jgi:hypothetical protein